MGVPSEDHHEPCPFCDARIERATFLESSRFRVIYNIAPILPGHSLVIPKTHVDSFLNLTEDELLEFVRLGRNAVRLLLSAFQVLGFNLTIKNARRQVRLFLTCTCT